MTLPMKETWTAEDEKDYKVITAGASAIAMSDAHRGVAATYAAASSGNVSLTSRDPRPTIQKIAAVASVVIGAVTSVQQGNPNRQANVVCKGRFILQFSGTYASATHYGKGITGSTTEGKVAATSGAATQQDKFIIIGGGNDTSTGGIGNWVMVEAR